MNKRAGKQFQWLKKYMKLEHLKDTLENKRLFLGDPNSWEDKNDAKLMELFKEARGYAAIRATCLTASDDRYHFWDIFGKKERGVCLWFDRVQLLDDISHDPNLCAGEVQYYMPGSLETKTVDHLPFAKRVQYVDEREFRVLRCYQKGEKVKGALRFRPSSLKRVYLNSWLTRKSGQVEMWESKIKDWTRGYSPSHRICVKRNRVTDYQEWKLAAEKAAQQ